MPKSLSKTPAPAKDRIYGSKVNPKGSASSEKSAKNIKLSADILLALNKKLKEFRENHKTKKVSLGDLKAVYRRGLGAYSSTHRPTISGGKPNTRNAWAMARVNAFLRKAGGGEAKKSYVQDDDLLKYAEGGNLKYNVLKEEKRLGILSMEETHRYLKEKYKSYKNKDAELDDLPSIYIRAGLPKIKKDGSFDVSKNGITGKKERGVSVFNAKYSPNSDFVFVNLTGGLGSDINLAYRDSQFYEDYDYDSYIRKMYLVDGNVIGYGSDGEPLLDSKSMKVIGVLNQNKVVPPKSFLKEYMGGYNRFFGGQEFKNYPKYAEGGIMIGGKIFEVLNDGERKEFYSRTYADGTIQEFTIEDYEKNVLPYLENGGALYLAPNGKPSNLTPEQYKLVRTTTFKAWFGDWENDPKNASKVVDENGEPLVVYHATDNEFSVFKEMDSYFSKIPIPRFGKRVIKSFLNLRKPYILHDANSWQNISISPKDDRSAEIYEYLIGLDDVIYLDSVSDWAKKNGYDGIIALNISETESGTVQTDDYIAYNSTQIKLADGSNTTFDANNPDIRYAEGGEVDEKEFIDKIIEDGCDIVPLTHFQIDLFAFLDSLKNDCISLGGLWYDSNPNNYAYSQLGKLVLFDIEDFYNENDNDNFIKNNYPTPVPLEKDPFDDNNYEFIGIGEGSMGGVFRDKRDGSILKLTASPFEVVGTTKVFNAQKENIKYENNFVEIYSIQNIGKGIFKGTWYYKYYKEKEWNGNWFAIRRSDIIPFDKKEQQEANCVNKIIKSYYSTLDKKNYAPKVFGSYDMYEPNREYQNYIKNMNANYKLGGEVDEHKETYKKWKSLVNMSNTELRRFYDSEEGKKAGLKPSEAKAQGIDSGRESARWIMKMKSTPVSKWTPAMWKWAKKQISFISRMSGMKGDLYDEKGRKTRKHLSLLIWGHNPKKYNAGGINEPFSNRYEKNKWVNINTKDLHDFKDEIFDLIADSYSYVGGNLEFQKPMDVANTDLDIWFATDIDSDPYIDALIGGKTTKNGTKLTTIAQDGENASKITLLKKVKDLMKERGFYAEVSKDMADKLSVPIVKDKAIITKVVNKPDITFNADGSYNRSIHGKKVTKVLVGVLNNIYKLGGETKADMKFNEPILYHEKNGNFLFNKNTVYIWLYDEKDAGNKLNSGEYDFVIFPPATLSMASQKGFVPPLQLIWRKKYQTKVKGSEHLIGIIQAFYDEKNKKMYIEMMTTNPKMKGKGIMTYLVKNLRQEFGLSQDDLIFVNTTKEGEKFKQAKHYENGGLIAPNGKPSNLTPEQWKLVRTPEFKAWFGDWENDPENASKVVDENGEPRVVYHATDNKFSVFKEMDSYFSKIPIPRFGKRIIKSFLNLRKPYILHDANSWQNISISPKDDRSAEVYDYLIGLDDVIYLDSVSDWAKKNGYDGIIALNISETESGTVQTDDYIAYNSNQIKLADGSNTTFDANNPDIRYDYGGELEKLGFTEEEIQNWKKQNKVSQRQEQNPNVKEYALKLKSGEISQDEYIKAVRKYLPIIPFTEVPQIPTLLEIVGALDSNKVEKGIIGYTQFINDGEYVASRLDIPAYNNYDVWVVSVHDGMKEGNSIGYGQTAYLKNVDFKVFPKTALNIATERTDKTPFARIFGYWINKDPHEVREMAVKYMNDPEWVQVGMNPYRHSWFYDKSDGMPLLTAEEVIQVGALVLAKNPVKTTPDNPVFAVDKNNPDIKFGKGGGVKAVGDCYETACLFAMPEIYRPKKIKFIGTPYLVQAEVQGQGAISHLRYGHAFIEDDENVYDFSNGRELILPKFIYYQIGDINTDNPKKYRKYTFAEARKKMLETGHYGHWDIDVKYSHGGIFKKHKSIEQIAKEKNVSLSYAKEQLKKGMQTESEHSDSKEVQETIALQHLDEMINYYDKLKTIEN